MKDQANNEMGIVMESYKKETDLDKENFLLFNTPDRKTPQFDTFSLFQTTNPNTVLNSNLSFICGILSSEKETKDGRVGCSCSQGRMKCTCIKDIFRHFNLSPNSNFVFQSPSPSYVEKVLSKTKLEGNSKLHKI